MDLDKKRKTKAVAIEETPWGCYVWQLPTGETLGEDGQFMLVFATKNDQSAIKAITQAARHYGYPEGQAVWWPDVRPISDEEFESQLDRAEQGLTPDPFDLGAIKEEMEAIKRGY